MDGVIFDTSIQKINAYKSLGRLIAPRTKIVESDVLESERPSIFFKKNLSKDEIRHYVRFQIEQTSKTEMLLDCRKFNPKYYHVLVTNQVAQVADALFTFHFETNSTKIFERVFTNDFFQHQGKASEFAIKILKRQLSALSPNLGIFIGDSEADRLCADLLDIKFFQYSPKNQEFRDLNENWNLLQ